MWVRSFFISSYGGNLCFVIDELWYSPIFLEVFCESFDRSAWIDKVRFSKSAGEVQLPDHLQISSFLHHRYDKSDQTKRIAKCDSIILRENVGFLRCDSLTLKGGCNRDVSLFQ